MTKEILKDIHYRYGLDDIMGVPHPIIEDTLQNDIEWLIGQAKELSNIKRLLNDMRRLERNGQLFVDGEAYNIQYNRSVNDLD